MNKTIDFSTELKDFSKEIESISKQMNKIEKKAMAAGGTYIAQQVRKDYSKYFPNKPRKHPAKPWPGDPENLRKSIKKKNWRKKRLGVTIWSYVHSYNPDYPQQKPILYGEAQAKGFTSEAKNAKYLTFQINGKWVKKKSVTVTGKPFTTEPAEKAATSSEIVKRMDAAAQKELDRIDKAKGQYKVK